MKNHKKFIGFQYIYHKNRWLFFSKRKDRYFKKFGFEKIIL